MTGALSWDDLRVLQVILQTGSLTQAAAALSLAQPTVGRRLDRLEAALGGAVVRRTSQGCVPTERGLAMLPLISQMQGAADGITQLAQSARNDLAGVVRIACGDFPAHYLSRRLPQILDGAPGLRLELVTGISFVRLERGDADLAVRSVPPEGDAWVAQPLGHARYAPYGAPDYIDAHPDALDARLRAGCRWLGLAASAPSGRWLREHLGRDPEVSVSNPLLLLQSTLAGLGLAVLPRYIGDSEPGLVRLGAPIAGLGFTSYLVVHPSARRLPRVRWVGRRVAEIFRQRVRDEPPEGSGEA